MASRACGRPSPPAGNNPARGLRRRRKFYLCRCSAKPPGEIAPKLKILPIAVCPQFPIPAGPWVSGQGV
eukprot:2084391-Lingulodinium_polyedra.AAC.1